MSSPLPFADSDDLPSDIPSINNPIPVTLVNSKPLTEPFIAPYVPCSINVVMKALEFAQVGRADTLIDLGCGDGRILFTSLLPSSTHSSPREIIGVELDPYLYDYCISRSSSLLQQEKGNLQDGDHGALSNKKTIKHKWLQQDMFKVDLNELRVTVAILYLLPKGLELLRPSLEKWLRQPKVRAAEDLAKQIEKRIVCVNYSIPGWEPERVNGVKSQEGKNVGMWLFYYNVNSIRP